MTTEQLECIREEVDAWRPEMQVAADMVRALLDHIALLEQALQAAGVQHRVNW